MFVGRCVMRTAESVLMTYWPRARRAIGVDAQVGGVDVDVDRLVDFGIDEDAPRGRVPARIRIEQALAHEAVNTRLAQVAVGVVAVHLDRRALDAGDFARRLLEDFDAKALALAIAQVHAQQHRRPVLRFGTAAARLDVEERVQDPADDGTSAGTRDRRRCARASPRPLRWRGAGIVALVARELVELAAVGEADCRPVERMDDAIELLLLLAELLCAGDCPKSWVLELAVDCREPRRLDVEVKDASRLPDA